MSKIYFSFKPPIALLAFGVLLSGGAHLAYAQQVALPTAAAEDSPGGLEEIVVTARKYSEKLQTAPVTVSVVTGETLQALDIDRPEDLAAITPGLAYQQEGSRYYNKPSIRGLTVNSIEYSNQKTNTFIDGIVFAGQFGSYPTNDGEIAQIEVLKGPQSTAFGRATLGGGINYITKDPSNVFTGTASAEYRTNDETHDYLFMSGPIIQDILKAYISVNYYSYHGPSGAEWHNQADGVQLGGESSEDIATKWELTPNDWLTVKLRGSYGFDDDGLPSFNFVAPSQNSAITQPNGSVVYIPIGPVAVSKANPDFPDSQMSNPGLRRETLRTNLTFDADLGAVTLTSTTAVNRQNDTITFGGLGGYAYCYIVPNYYGCPTTTFYPNEQDGAQLPTLEQYFDVQQEFRLTSNGDGPFKYMVGADYFNWWWYENFTGYDSSNLTRTQSYAAFFSLSYKVTDELTLGLEGRENHDEIENLGPGIFAKGDYNRFLPRVTADYQFTPDFMAYAVISEGSHPGSFNAIPGLPATQTNVKEELLWNYEAGIKSEWLDHHLRFNLAGYHEEWTNQQLLQNVLILQPQGYSQIDYILTNVGKSHIDGVELEVEAVPMTGASIRGTLGYDNAVFDSYCSATYYQLTGIGNSNLQCRSVAGKTLALQPPLTMSIVGSYEAPLVGDWNWFVNAEWSYRSKEYSDETNLSWAPASNIVNAHVGVNTDQYHFEAFVYNLTQETSPAHVATTNDFLLPGDALAVSTAPQKPRQFGVKATYSWGGAQHEDAGAPTTAAYVPPPVQAPAVAHSYMVFFDFNKSDLTPEAVKVVDQAAAKAAPAKVTRIDVTGHTDTVGSDAYNMRLSRRRAESVAAELQARGIPSSEIAIFAKGKKDLLVPTADGVREPQNRRVQIVYEDGPNA